MDVGVDVLGAVELHDPVDGGEVDAARGDVCAEEGRVLALHELEVDGSALGLLLTAVQLEDLGAGLQTLEGFVGETHLLAGAEEDYALAALVALQEAEQCVKLLLYVDLHVVVE